MTSARRAAYPLGAQARVREQICVKCGQPDELRNESRERSSSSKSHRAGWLRQGVEAVLGSERQAVAMTDLDVAYREQLEAQLARPGAPWQAAWQTRAMLAWMETHAGGRLAADDVARAWVWSDLHLDHGDIVWHLNRPFQTLDGMRRALLEAWRQTVGEGDLVICGGDVTVGAPSRAIRRGAGRVAG